jgi:GT2 family glycosyltransferase
MIGRESAAQVDEAARGTELDAGPKVDVGIVLVNFNGSADTLPCLQSLERVQGEHCRVVVVDNGSSRDETSDWGTVYPWVESIRREDNGGWAGGNNTGIRHALEQGAEWVLLLNNDTVVDPGIVDRLLSAASHHPGYGILGPVICSMDDRERVMTDGCRFNHPESPGFFDRVEVPLQRLDPPRVEPVEIVNGCCIMISRRVFETIGLIDERFFLIHEESDFCLRARRAGFECGILAEPLVWHKQSSSFSRAGMSLQRYYDARNLFLLLRKHRKNHPGGRGAFPSWLEYLKYVYYRFSIEREQGQDKAADAVLCGLCDALAARYGPQGSPPRLSLAVARHVFRMGHSLRGGRARR